MQKYEEFASEQDCLDDIPLDDAAAAFSGYVGEANAANLLHDTCVDKAPDSQRVICNYGAFQPDKMSKF
jgi:hypothetical protein